MSGQVHLTDALLRAALTPADDDVTGLASGIRSAIADTPQRRPWWTPFRPLIGPVAPRWVRFAVTMLVVGALLAGLLLVVVGSRRPSVLPGDGSMFHGSPARTGVVAGAGPIAPPELLWNAPLPGPLANESPALQGGRLFVADGQGHVGEYDTGTGANEWSLPLARPATSPASADGVLVVAAGDGVHGIDEQTHDARWEIPSTEAVRSPVAVVSGVAIVGLPDGSVVAADVQSGATRWRTAIGGHFTRALAVADGVVFAGDDEGTLTALDGADGHVIWSRQLGDGALSSTAVSGGVVFAATGLDHGGADHVLHAVDRETGTDVWTFEAPTGATLYVGGVHAGVVYAVSLDGFVYAIADGEERWRFDTGAAIGSVATISGDLIYVSSSQGRIYALDLASGASRWDVPVDGDPGPVVVSDGRLYVGTTLGRLYAFAESPSASP